MSGKPKLVANVQSFDETRKALAISDKYLSAVVTSTANVASPPTDAQLDAAFGTPAQVGNGFVGAVDDAGGDAAQWLVVSNGTSWWYVALTKAV